VSDSVSNLLANFERKIKLLLFVKEKIGVTCA